MKRAFAAIAALALGADAAVRAPVLRGVGQGTATLTANSSSVAANATALSTTVTQQTRLAVHAWFQKVLRPEESVADCAEESAAMMRELRYAYSRRMVPQILEEECTLYLYYERFHQDMEVCLAMVQGLERTWRGDQDYKAWCEDVFAKRGEFKTAEDVPVIPDPGPRKGKYADVEQFSFPNDADPESPCHGSKPCPSHRGEADAEIYDRGQKPVGEYKGSGHMEWRPEAAGTLQHHSGVVQVCPLWAVALSVLLKMIL